MDDPTPEQTAAAIALAEAIVINEESAEVEGWGGCWFCAGAKCDVCQHLLPAYREVRRG